LDFTSQVIQQNGGCSTVSPVAASSGPRLVLDPQHGGGHVPDGTPGAARIGGHDHQTATRVAPLLACGHEPLGTYMV